MVRARAPVPYTGSGWTLLTFEHHRRNSGNSPFVKAEETQMGAGSGGREQGWGDESRVRGPRAAENKSNRLAEEEKEKETGFHQHGLASLPRRNQKQAQTAYSRNPL